MRRLLMVAALAGLSLALSGCTTVVGDWQLKSIRPESAKVDFGITTLLLSANGTYSANGANGGPAKHTAGTYQYDSKAELLTLTEDGGAVRMYHAQICGPCGTLRLWNADDPMRWEVYFVPKQ